MKRYFILILFTSIYSGILSQNYEVTPASLNFNAEPGESQTRFINVKNHSSKSETFIMSVSDFSVNSKGEGEYVEAGSLKQSIANWISIAPTFFELEPNGEKEIAVTLQMPVDQYGSKWGVIFAKTAQEQTAYSVDKSVNAGIRVSPRVAIDVYQTPGTNKAYSATIGSFMESLTSEDSIRSFSAIVNNLGDLITPCLVYLIATNVETAEEIYFPETSFSLYPKSSRKLALTIDKKLPKGTYSLAAILDYGSKENLEGAQMVIVVD